MIYLRNLIDKLSLSTEGKDAARELKTDEEIYDYIIKYIKLEELQAVFEEYYNIPFAYFNSLDISSKVLESINWRKAGIYKSLPFKEDGNTLYIASINALNSGLRNSVAGDYKKLGYTIRFVYALERNIMEHINRMTGNVEEKSGGTEQFLSENSEKSASDWIDAVIGKGVDLGASDIHIEPLRNGLQLRYRIDGVLSVKKQFAFSREFVNNVLSRLKLISHLDIAEKRKPQDGRIDNFQYQGNIYDIRTSSISTIYGEKLVLRVFQKEEGVLYLEDIGFYPKDKGLIEDIIMNPYGAIYLSGATGSGKTTTMYSLINHIVKDELNICSVEDPVEKTLDKVNQVDINELHETGFADMLTAFLRQDPDVIMIGEIRDDAATADLALRAAQTGHLVVSTVHANNALSTFTRLLSMNVDKYLLFTSTLAVVSQRLVRMLCDCKAPADLSDYQQKYMEYLQRTYGLESVQTYEPCGCEKCNYIGYKGRTIIYEILQVDEMTDENKLEEYVSGDNFTPIELNGYYKVREGITSVEELIRSTRKGI